ncbi:MAG: hypothetical protein PGN25_04095 [Methylorubrum populi]
MQDTSELLPRVFQANLDRLYTRVVRSALDLLPTHADALIAGPGPADELLARLAMQVDNHTAQEACRAFALVLAATFERQLRLWSRMVLPELGAARVARCKVAGLLDRIMAVRGLELAPDVRPAIEEMLLLANVVRHGDGPSCDALRKVAPDLWGPGVGTFDQAMPASPLHSDGLGIGPADLHRYASALFQFWGAADAMPLATVDAPY